MKKAVMLFTLMGLLALSQGCTRTQQWMAGGALAGAAIGGPWGASMGILSAGEAAGVGILGGAAAGALIADMTAEDLDALLKERDAEIERLKNSNKLCDDELARLKAELEKCLAAARTVVDSDPIAEAIVLPADVLFDSGKARLGPEGRTALDNVAAKIKSQYPDRFIMVEGHTDTDPIVSSGWKDNWELGAQRSLTVVRYLIEKGVNVKHLGASSYSEYHPVGADKAKNRRAAILIHVSGPKH